jgi:hypothetical protein
MPPPKDPKKREEWKRKISESLKGKPLAEETKRKISESLKETYKDPEAIARKSAATKRRWDDPEERARWIEAMTEVANRPERKAMQSEISTEMWSDPERRKRQSEIIAEYWQDPEFRDMISVAHKEAMQDPEHRARMSDVIRERWEDGGVYTTVEYMENLSRAVASWLVNLSNSLETNPQLPYVYSEKAMRDVPYRESYEYAFIKILDNDPEVLWFNYECVLVPYEFDGCTHHYVPDFVVLYTDDDWEVVEIKPKAFLDDPMNVAKFKAAEAKYGDHFVVLTEKDLFNN